MTTTTLNPLDFGLEVIDIGSEPEFARRRLHVRNVGMQMAGLQRLAKAFVERPETILQELVDAAIDLCGAERAGISIERDEKTDEHYYEWVATSGKYTGFVNAVLPRYPSACSICIERNGPQLFRVQQAFFDWMKVDAAVVTDGLLIPWQVQETHGTIWIMAHGSTEAFDSEDLRMMEALANFAAMAVRHQRQQKLLMHQAGATAAAAMANELAHRINNPPQSLTNVVYLASTGERGAEARSLANELSDDLQKLSGLVARLLRVPETVRRSN